MGTLILIGFDLNEWDYSRVYVRNSESAEPAISSKDLVC